MGSRGHAHRDNVIGEVSDDDAARAVAERHEVSVSEVVFAFARSLGMLPLTGTTDPAHMAADLRALELALSDDEVAALEKLAL